MRWYTAIGMKKDDADGRFCVWVDREEKVLTEMETILWAALTWSFCEEDKVHSQMYLALEKNRHRNGRTKRIFSFA